jgi:hypothetical protein
MAKTYYAWLSVMPIKTFFLFEIITAVNIFISLVKVLKNVFVLVVYFLALNSGPWVTYNILSLRFEMKTNYLKI